MPRLIRPGPNERTPYDVTFEWMPVAGALEYEIQVAGNEQFSEPLVLDDGVAEPSYPVNLLVADPVWWRVRAVDARGAPLPWSAARKLQIVPPPLATSVFAVTVTPNSVPGGEDTDGMVSLSTPAPKRGATVNLRSDNPAGVVHPRLVIFPEGETAAAFPISTSPVTSQTEARISASSRGDTQTAKLTILPPRPRARLTGFAVNPAILAAGSSTQGTVTLSGPAGSATTVTLASGDRSRVLVPASVTVPPGRPSRVSRCSLLTQIRRERWRSRPRSTM